MDAAKKLAGKHNLQDLVPLNALSDARFAEVAQKIVIEELRKGRYLFRKGDRDNQSIYLLDGKINLIDGHRKVTGEVEAGTDMSRYPIANQQPRPLSARAVTRVVIARIDSGLLDVFLTWDQTTSTEATEITAEDNEDWMTRMLQSEAFIKIPPALIQRLLIKMQSYPARKGEVIIRQGDEGDFFYTIHKGTCVVTRTREDGQELRLAELSDGDCFGEESLVSDARRNASVTMATDGLLMRLAKSDFIELLQKPLVRHVNHEEAVAMIDEGAVWLDVRSAGEYESGAFEDSANIPLADLRDEIPELVYNAKYIICCDTGRRSASAAFMLSHKGFEVYVLDGGMNGLVPAPAEGDAAGMEPAAPAGIVDLSGRPENVAEQPADTAQPAGAVPGESTAELEALRAEVAALQQQLDEHASGEQQLDGRMQEVSALQQEVTRLQEQEALLREQYAALQEEYDERLQQVSHELEQAREASASLEALAENADHEAQCRVEQFEREQEGWRSRVGELEAQLAESLQGHERLLAGRDADREQIERLQETAASAVQHQQDAQAATNSELESLRAELCSLGQERERLAQELSGEQQRAGELQQQLDARLEGQGAESAELQEQARQLQHSLQELQTEHERLQAQKRAVEAEAEDRAAGQEEALARLQAELDSLREHAEQQQAEISAERQRAEELQQQVDTRLAGHEAESAGLQEQARQLQSALDAAEAEKQDLSAQLRSLRESQDEAVGQAHRETDALQQELDRLRADKRELEISREDGNRQLEDSQSARQAAEAALQHQQQDWERERAGLQEDLGGLQGTIAELREQLDRSREEAESERARIEEEGRASADRALRQVEDLESHRAQLQEEHRQLQEELQSATAERDGIRRELDEERQRGDALKREAEGLNDKLSSLAAELESEVGRLNEQLRSAQQQAAETGQQLEAGAADNAKLRATLADEQEAGDRLRGEVESLTQQLEAVQQELQQAQRHSRCVEQESEESLRKAWDDLNRKNDAEKEMQGQIARLRKKLEQSAADIQQVREEAREAATQARDVLHAERRERAEERAQMAARQRELKEQLVTIAGQHEQLQSNQQGALVQAENAARKEERARLKEFLETHARAEDQLAALRRELEQARDETERAVSEERQRNTADLELLQAQKTELEAAVSDQEGRLQELTRERDAAVLEQQSIRKQLNSLRAEVEIARGLINASGDGEVENPVKLRTELEEARRNLDIAVRVRGEAESARDTAFAERDALQRQLEDAGVDAMPLPIPCLDEGADGGQGDAPGPLNAADVAESANRERETATARATAEPGHGRVRSWSVKAAGLVAMCLLVPAVWFVLNDGVRLPGGVTDALDRLVARLAKDTGNQTADAPAAPVVAPVLDVKPSADRPLAAETRGRPEPTQKTPATTPEPEPAAPVKAVTATGQQPEPAGKPVTAPEPPPIVAGRSFSDALADGGRGPAMVELPAAGFLMGSSSSSPNFAERPQHPVSLQAFAISRYEVTFEEYDRFARATGRRLPNDEGWGRGRRPVINVSWQDATAYTDWLSRQTGHTYQLPSEAQWEFAARAGTTTPHWWPDTEETIPANCFDCGSEWDGRQTAPVGRFAENGLGLHDIAGNVQEWTQDCYHNSYNGAPSDGTAWLSAGCSQRVVRGGAYSSPVDSLRSARRAQFDQDTRLDNLGFRVVRVR